MNGRAATLLAICATLVCMGVVMVYSTSAVRAVLRQNDATFFLRRQILWVGLASLGLVVTWQTDLDTLRRLARPALACILILLVLLIVPGVAAPVNGARRWFRIGGFGIQPSELAKLAVILVCAEHAARRDDAIRSFRAGFVPPFALLAATGVLIALEPDFGTAALVLTVGSATLLVAGVRVFHMAVCATPVMVGLLAYMATRADYVLARITSFMNPEATRLGKGYQVHQALLALGSGGPFGLGLGQSRQKWLFLPDEHTDFILAILGEELGFVGTALTVSLYVLLLVYGGFVLWHARDRFGFLVAFGVLFALGIQAAMNVAVVTASIPAKGISLPFLSFGGSSLVVSLAGLGLLLNVASREKQTDGTVPERGEGAA